VVFVKWRMFFIWEHVIEVGYPTKPRRCELSFPLRNFSENKIEKYFRWFGSLRCRFLRLYLHLLEADVHFRSKHALIYPSLKTVLTKQWSVPQIPPLHVRTFIPLFSCLLTHDRFGCWLFHLVISTCISLFVS
jgi:hypothetical protein